MTINIFTLEFYTFCARWSFRVSLGHWKSVVLLSWGATGQPLHSSLWLPLFSADEWLSQPPLIRAFLPIHQLSIPGFQAQKDLQKQRQWLTGQIYQHNLLTQINKNSPTSKEVLSYFSHHFISWDSVLAEKLKKPGSSFDHLRSFKFRRKKTDEQLKTTMLTKIYFHSSLCSPPGLTIWSRYV